MDCVAKCKDEQATPLPKAKVLVVLSIGFGNVFGSVVLFPFLPFMVQDFFPHLSKEELGLQAGYLGSAYFIGNFAGSMVWGWLSDVWGRRPALLVGSIGIIFASLLFGFSQNFATAVTARFLWGLLNGNFSVAKTYLSEILDDSNQAKGFSTFGMGSGLGRIFGSVVGGFLAQPASKYSLFQNDFFCTYQYILPIFVNVAIAAVGFIGVFLVVEETLRSKSKDESEASDVSSTSTADIELNVLNDDDDDSKTVNTSADIATVSRSDQDSLNHSAMTHESIELVETELSDVDALLGDDDDVTVAVQLSHYEEKSTILNFLRSSFKRFSDFQKHQCIECCYCCLLARNNCRTGSASNTPQKLSAKVKAGVLLRLRLLWDRRVILAVLMYGLVGGVTILSNEIYPLLLVTDHVHGGYNMDDNEIALFIMIAGVVLLFYQVVAYSRIAKLIGYRHLLQISLIIFAIGNFLLPWANLITGPIGGYGLESGSGESSITDSGYCHFNYSKESFNEDSVKRFPADVWAIMLVITLMIVIGRISSLVTLVVLINNSAVTNTRGTVNGLGQAFLAIFRSFTPALGSILFAWSEKNDLSWPLDHHLTFDLCAIGSIAIVFFTLCFPKSIEKKRTA